VDRADPLDARRAAQVSARFALPALLLVAEYLGISLLVDLPTSGPARGLADTLRVLIPVLLGTLAAASLLGGRAFVARATPLASTLPPWRPWPMLAAQVAAYAALAAAARSLLGPEAPPAGPWTIAVWFAGAFTVGLIGIAVAVPLRLLARIAGANAAVPAAALGCSLLAWRAASAAESAWGTLSGPTLHGIAWLLALAGQVADVDHAARSIGVGGFSVEIAPICSGADGIGLVLVFQALWIAIRRRDLSVPRALLLLPAGAAGAFLANVVRVAALILVGASGAEEVAAGGFHSKAGWILFLGLALGSVALAERWRWLRRGEPSPGVGLAPVLPEEAAAHLAPLLAVLAAALGSGAVAAGPLDRLYGARVLAGAGALLALRRALPRPSVAPALWPAAVGAAVAGIWCLLPGGDGAALEAAFRSLPAAERLGWIVARLAGSVLVIPVVEELAFRGFLLRWLAEPRGPWSAGGAPPGGVRRWSWSAVLLSSLAFGAVHDAFLLGAASGVAFAYASTRRGRLSDAVVAHAVANACIALAVLAAGRWDLWA